MTQETLRFIESCAKKYWGFDDTFTQTTAPYVIGDGYAELHIRKGDNFDTYEIELRNIEIMQFPIFKGFLPAKDEHIESLFKAYSMTKTEQE